MVLLLLAADGPCLARWARLAQPTDADLNAIQVFSDGNGWAAGNGGTVLHSADGGQTWEPQFPGVRNRLLCVSFASPRTGLVSGEGGDAAWTGDGGQSWRPVTVVADDMGLGPPDGIVPVVATGDQTAWALARWADASFLYHTSDAGQTWQPVRYTDGGYNSPNTVYAMAFSSDAEGWLVASRIGGPPQAYTPVFLQTTDVGAHWLPLDAYATDLNQPTSPQWNATLALAAPDNLLAHIWDPVRGTGGLFHGVRDERDVWRQIVAPLEAPINTVSFPDPADAWLVGDSTFESVDYVRSFRRTDHEAPLAASFPSAGLGWAVSAGGVVYQWEEGPAGDVTGDGMVDITDAVEALALATGLKEPGPLSTRMADVDPAPAGDGILTVADAARILAMAAGLE